MRVVFLGTPSTAVHSLEALLAAGHDVTLVVTQPDRPAGRSGTPRPPPVSLAARARGVRVVQPFKVRTAEFAAVIAGEAPDVLAVVAYGRILPAAVLEAAPLGAINVHFSLLPSLRGAAPVPWALARGEHATGVTTFRIDAGLDTGDVLLQRRVAIESGEHAPALLERLAAIGGSLLVETLAGLEAGTITPVPQDHTRATAAPILTRADGLWDPAWTALDLEGRVRGFDPWPGVWASRGGARLRLVDAQAVPGATTGAAPGTILELRGVCVHVACAAGTVAAVASVQPEGRRALAARDAVNGRQLALGDRLGRVESAA